MLYKRALPLKFLHSVVKRHFGTHCFCPASFLRGLSILDCGSVPFDLRPLHRNHCFCHLNFGLGLR